MGSGYDPPATSPVGPQEVSGMPVGGVLRAFLALAVIAAAVLAFFPGALEWAVRTLAIEPASPLPDPSTLRLVAFVALMILLLAQAIAGSIAIRAKTARIWGALAMETGGEWMPRGGASGPPGARGPMVRWSRSGVPVTLARTRAGEGGAATTFLAHVRLARPFQLYVIPRNTFTKVLSAPGLWKVMLEVTVRQGSDGPEPQARREAISGLRFMAAPEIATGNPALDEALIVKSDQESLAREIISSSRVSDAILALKSSAGGWMLTLGIDSVASHRLLLQAPGIEHRESALRAAASLLDALLACLRAHDLMETRSTAA